MQSQALSSLQQWTAFSFKIDLMVVAQRPHLGVHPRAA
jgi:hypothetical protein